MIDRFLLYKILDKVVKKDLKTCHLQSQLLIVMFSLARVEKNVRSLRFRNPEIKTLLTFFTRNTLIQTPAYLIDDDTKLVAGEQLILRGFNLLDANILLLDARPDLLDVGADLAGLLQELVHRAAGVGVVLGQFHYVALDGLDVVLQLQLTLLHALLAGLDVVDDAGHALQQRQDGQGTDGVPGLILHPEDLQLLLDSRRAILVLIHCCVSMTGEDVSLKFG